MENVKEQIIKILSDKLGCDEEIIDNETSITNDLGADSLDVVEIIMEIERQFDIHISDEDAEKIATVGDLINEIKKMQ